MKSKVYFLPISDGASKTWVEGVSKIYDICEISAGIRPKDFVGIKTHVGEGDGNTFIPPELIVPVVKKVKKAGGQPFLIETSTLYRGSRDNAIKHAIQAHKHGFTCETVGAPFISVDGLAGESEREVEINAPLFKTVKVAYDVPLIDYLIVLTHPTGHPCAGLGAAIKNVGMGLTSRKAKRHQHSKMKPEVDPPKCTFCKKCIPLCPVDAISEANEKAFIDSKVCIGCGECLAVCQFGAVKFDWNKENSFTQRSMAEHSLGVLKGKENRSVFINICLNMTEGCDCYGTRQKKAIPDIGILASRDIVAVDQATLDLTIQPDGKNLAKISFPAIDPTAQLAHGQKIGLGSRDYELVQLK